MLYLLQELFINNWRVLRIFKSIMLRASVAFMIAFLFMLILGKPFIAWLKKKKYGDTAREEGPKSHFDQKEKIKEKIRQILEEKAVLLKASRGMRLEEIIEK